MAKQPLKFRTIRHAAKYIAEVDSVQIVEYRIIYKPGTTASREHWIVKIKRLEPLNKPVWFTVME